MIGTIIPPHVSESQDACPEENKSRRWSIRLTILFCLITCGSFWGVVGYFAWKYAFEG